MKLVVQLGLPTDRTDTSLPYTDTWPLKETKMDMAVARRKLQAAKAAYFVLQYHPLPSPPPTFPSRYPCLPTLATWYVPMYSIRSKELFQVIRIQTASPI